MPTNPVGTWVDPAFGSQTGTSLKTNYDNAHKVAKRKADRFAPHEASPPDLTIVLDAGFTWDGVTLTEVGQQTSAALVAPSVNPRIDRVVVDRVTGVLQVETGAEAPAPVAPAIPAGKDPVARIDWLTSTLAIVNGIITDERAHSPDLETPLPRSYLAGLGLANNAVDLAHDIDIAEGACRDSVNSENMLLASALVKRIDEAFAVGTNQGGWSSDDITGGTTVTFTDNGGGFDFVDIDAGTWTATPALSNMVIVTGGLNAGYYQCHIAPTATRITVQTGLFVAEAASAAQIRIIPTISSGGAWVYVFLIKRTDTGVVDVMMALSPTAPVLPAGYDKFRRIFDLFVIGTAPGGDILRFLHRGDRVSWWQAQDGGVTFWSTAGSIKTMRIPPIPGMTWLGRVRMEATIVAAGLVTSPLNDNIAPLTGSRFHVRTSASSQDAQLWMEVETDDGTIRERATSIQDASFMTIGYIDSRGRDD